MVEIRLQRGVVVKQPAPLTFGAVTMRTGSIHLVENTVVEHPSSERCP